MSFLLAWLVAVATLVIVAGQLLAQTNTATKNGFRNAGLTLGIGLTIAALIVASHWW